MLKFPNAKINLGLYITGKFADGFHEIETVFYPLPWFDALEVIEKPSLEKKYNFTQTGIDLNCGNEENLVIKAYEVLSEKYKLPKCEIYLHKNIPSGAGLGGGSADAAFMLMLLNEKFSLNIPKNELINFAIKLGSDVPFFLENKPVLATGKGNIFSDIEVILSGKYFVVVFPEISISTGLAYNNSTLNSSKKNSLNNAITKPLSEWKNYIENDFEKYVFKQFPEIENIKKVFYSQNAIFASLSGSGSSVFGIFEKEPEEIIFDKKYIVHKGIFT